MLDAKGIVVCNNVEVGAKRQRLPVEGAVPALAYVLGAEQDSPRTVVDGTLVTVDVGGRVDEELVVQAVAVGREGRRNPQAAVHHADMDVNRSVGLVAGGDGGGHHKRLFGVDGHRLALPADIPVHVHRVLHKQGQLGIAAYGGVAAPQQLSRLPGLGLGIDEIIVIFGGTGRPADVQCFGYGFRPIPIGFRRCRRLFCGDRRFRNCGRLGDRFILFVFSWLRCNNVGILARGRHVGNHVPVGDNRHGRGGGGGDIGWGGRRCDGRLGCNGAAVVLRCFWGKDSGDDDDGKKAGKGERRNLGHPPQAFAAVELQQGLVVGNGIPRPGRRL